MFNLNALTQNLPKGARIITASGLNEAGQILVDLSFNTATTIRQLAILTPHQQGG